MHTRASAFRMQLSTWTGWLLSFLSACVSGTQVTHVSAERLRRYHSSPAGIGGWKWGGGRSASQNESGSWVYPVNKRVSS